MKMQSPADTRTTLRNVDTGRIKRATVAITGASGTIGRAIIPQLREMGFRLILFGRDASSLRAIFPDLTSANYDDLPAAISGCDALIHLAVRNNNVDGDLSQFMETNVRWPVGLATQARDAGVRRFIQLSSTHAIDPNCTTNYAVSKRSASESLHDLNGNGISELVAPRIYDAERGAIYGWFWNLLGALKPTLPSSELTSAIAQEIEVRDNSHRVRFLSKEHPRPVLYTAVTTLVDLGFSIAIILAFGWLLVLIALAIRLESKGPALFKQVRVGLGKRPFVCWKFRTMYVGTAHRATHETSASSITRVGGFLRRTKLDELPQVVNLLRRELSLVGPRPCLPSQMELIEERDKRDVYSVRPGITGLAQVNHVDMSDPVKLAMWDERYCALRALLFDLRILVLTFLGGGRGDRVDMSSEARQ